MTISGLAKMLVGVNNIVVENLDFSANDNEIVISARPYERDRCRCGICDRKAPRYDCENGLRRWRAMDSGRLRGGKKEKTKLELQVEAVRSAKYLLLMNPENLSETYRAKLQQILLRDRRLATAYRLKEDLRLIFKMDISEVSAALEKWRRRAWSCRIPQFVELQRKSSITRTLFFQPSGMVFPTQELKRPTTKSSCLSEWLMVFAILKTSSR